ncbi:hypothetical protein ABDK00_013555 [Niabella insulamsoli]|uniref:hypothetical protein n=1 Tax=Niabella insulamsoli TaxID=3144874 RepID=UPI0031FD21E2
MKKVILFIVMVIGANFLYGQNKAWQNIFGSIDAINPEYFKKLDELRTFKSKDPGMLISADGNTHIFRERSGKKYDKVIFKVGGQKLYAPAKVVYTRDKYPNRYGTRSITEVSVLPTGDIRFLSNDQLFCPGDAVGKKPGYQVANDKTIYNEDGSVHYAQQSHNYNNKTLYVREGNKRKNEPSFRFMNGSASIFGSYTLNHSALSPWIFDANFSAKQFGEILNRTPKGFYKGTPHIGKFMADSGEEYRGFFGPVAGMPQGSVLFRTSGNQSEWVLVVGGNIEKAIPARASEAPDLLQLQQQLSVAAYTGSGLFQDGARAAKYPYPELLGNYTSQPSNGYGVKYATTGDPTPGKELLFEVGIFKNGKLNGLGYRLTGTTNFWGSDISSKLVFNLYAEAGVFINGKLIDGREFSPGMFYGKSDTDQDRNIWAKSPVEGFSYIKNSKSPVDTFQFYEKVPYEQLGLRANAKVFVQNLNRWVPVFGISGDKKILLKGDNNNLVTLNKNIGDVYYESTTTKIVEVGCPKTKVVPRYKTVTQDVNWKDSKGRTILTEQDRSGYLKPVKLWTSKKEVLDRYETVACSICGGRGYIQRPTQEKQMYKIDFNDGDFYTKVSKALQAMGDGNATLFGTDEHMKFEAENFLQLYNNPKTRTYTDLKNYMNKLQYEWIRVADNSQIIYETFADVFYLIYQQHKGASYNFVNLMHKNSFDECLKIISKKYPEARSYLREVAKKSLNKD